MLFPPSTGSASKKSGPTLKTLTRFLGAVCGVGPRFYSKKPPPLLVTAANQYLSDDAGADGRQNEIAVDQ